MMENNWMMPIRFERRLGTLDHAHFPIPADVRGLCKCRSWHILSVHIHPPTIRPFLVGMQGGIIVPQSLGIEICYR